MLFGPKPKRNEHLFLIQKSGFGMLMKLLVCRVPNEVLERFRSIKDDFQVCKKCGLKVAKPVYKLVRFAFGTVQ